MLWRREDYCKAGAGFNKTNFSDGAGAGTGATHSDTRGAKIDDTRGAKIDCDGKKNEKDKISKSEK